MCSFGRYARILGPKYADGIHAPTVSKSGAPLPNSRLLSLSVFGEATFLDDHRTLALLNWGQFIAHDISRLSTDGAPSMLL